LAAREADPPDESDLDSAVGCTGAVYALRRACFQPLPEDTLLDDVVEPMLIAAQGKRVRFDATALAYDPQTLDGALEQRRKVRTLAGNFQMLTRYPAWMLPGGHRLWWQLVLHKYLRLAGPFLLMLTLAASLALLDQPFFKVAAAAHGAVALLAGNRLRPARVEGEVFFLARWLCVPTMVRDEGLGIVAAWNS